MIAKTSAIFYIFHQISAYSCIKAAMNNSASYMVGSGTGQFHIRLIPLRHAVQKVDKLRPVKSCSSHP